MRTPESTYTLSGAETAAVANLIDFALAMTDVLRDAGYMAQGLRNADELVRLRDRLSARDLAA